MRPYVSIIIPSYNAQKSIVLLLSSIYKSLKVDKLQIEVLVIDDCSHDETILTVEKFILNHTKISIKILALKKNKGPAHARNIGARHASGTILFFLDSDVVLHTNSLFELIYSFHDPDIHALTGVWDKKQTNHAFFPKFKALRDWSYWINERDPKNYYYLFSTRVAAIKRDLFLRLGGFDETYKTALVEDIELTYRIARRYAVIFNPKVSVHHEFEDFIPIARKYFWRSYYWSKIYRERKKFDPVATTGKEAITTISAGLFVVLTFAYFVLSIVYYVLSIEGLLFIYFKYLLLTTLYIILFIHLWGVRKFLAFCLKEEGAVFTIKAFFTGIILYLIILAGAGFSTISSGKRK